MTAYGEENWHDNETGTVYTAGSKYFKASKVTKDSGSSVWSIEDSPKWINEVDMTFWSWVGFESPAPGPEPVDNDLSDNKATISYTNNGTLDLLYAFNREKRTFDSQGKITDGAGTYKSGKKDAMDIKFSHALAAVRFDVSPLKKEGMTIKSIKFKGVVNKADFTVSLASTDFTETADGEANALMSMTESTGLRFESSI